MSFFIALEGGECAGKSTQIKSLAQWFERRQQPYLITREPGGTLLGESIRHIFLSDEAKHLGGLPEALLMLAQRRQHLDEVILPALASGKVVISDRFYLSTIVYQGHGRGIDVETLKSLTQQVLGDDIPDLTIVFDVPVETSRERLELRGSTDRLEQSNLSFFNKIREGFLKEAQLDSSHIAVVDAAQSIEDIFSATTALISERIGTTSA